MYKPLVIKSEFRIFCKLGANVGRDAELEQFIRDMQELTFRATIDEPFYQDCIGDTSARPQLQSFINEFIKPYIICGAYEKFLLWHGNNISQFGIRQNNEDTSEAVSDKIRGELIADTKRKTNAYLSIMNRELKTLNYTFDGVAYTFFDDSNKRFAKRNIGIKQVGNSNVNNDNYNYKRNCYDY